MTSSVTWSSSCSKSYRRSIRIRNVNWLLQAHQLARLGAIYGVETTGTDGTHAKVRKEHVKSSKNTKTKRCSKNQESLMKNHDKYIPIQPRSHETQLAVLIEILRFKLFLLVPTATTSACPNRVLLVGSFGLATRHTSCCNCSSHRAFAGLIVWWCECTPRSMIECIWDFFGCY